MINNNLRIGNFTSSEIAALMTVAKDGKSFGAPAKTYIEEKNMERRLGRSLNTETSAKPTSWGRLLEDHVFPLLGKPYRAMGTISMKHPDIDFWAGSPDAVKPGEAGKTVVDIKCPYTLKSFCTLADCRTIEEVRENHKEGDKYFYQLVSNAIITGSRFAELVIFCPYQSELNEIRKMCEGDPKYYWLFGSQDEDLPYLPNGGFYKNLNIISFEVSAEDKKELTDRVLAAGALLEKIEQLKAA